MFISYATLRILHVTAIVMTFMGLSGLLALRLAGGAPLAKRLIFHFTFGIGMLTIPVTGFALAHFIGLHGAPPWLMGKFVIWLLAGASMVLVNRFYRFAPWIVVFLIALIGTAAWLAIEKPF